MGDVSIPRGAGIRVLSLDGGGTRGVLGLDVLQALENNLKGSKASFLILIGIHCFRYLIFGYKA